MITLQPVILSGGSGTRLWPLSRSYQPKQFLQLTGGDSLLQATVGRLADIPGVDLLPGLIVCNRNHRFLVAEQMAEACSSVARILLEPIGRNTAPALTLAALDALALSDTDPVLIGMPADHVIADLAAFRRAVSIGLAAAADGAVVTFGIVPDGPETGFGYLQCGEALADGSGARRLMTFVEKPDLDTATAYVASGDYLWNAGIFMLRASRWLELAGQHCPAILDGVRSAYQAAEVDGDFLHIARTAFEACPSDSIDYAVMEPLTQAGDGELVVVPLDAGWSDIGAWSALWRISDRDGHGNARRGDVFAFDAFDNLLFSQSRMVAAVGVKDLIVVETADAVLVAHKDSAQDVKRVVDHLKSGSRTECDLHRRVHRPWGSYEGMDGGSRFQVKRLTVKPGASLSLQMHHHRAEHWIVVRGTARVTIGEQVTLLSENQSVYIPLGTSHRLENPGVIPLEIVEVQTGSYLGEDDIVRFQDDYNRGSTEAEERG
jgi:mannose-1-phosphate guanylyltransferase / mannose-6-phosphate isomerase